MTGPSIRIELNNASGNVDIQAARMARCTSMRKVTPGGWSVFSNGEKSAQEIVANPPLEQRGDTILIGKNSSFLKNVTIDYTIEVPANTELDANSGLRWHHGEQASWAGKGNLRFWLHSCVSSGTRRTSLRGQRFN